MSALLDGLSYVGDSLDKLGGRAIRGALGGHPRELASVVPFSDRFGLTNPNDRVSGRQLTDRAGITRRGDQGWGAWGAGLGTEMALDPLNFVSGGMAVRGAAKGLGGLRRSDDLIRRLGNVGEASRPAMKIPPGGGNLPSHVANLADAYGPGYRTSPYDLASMLRGAPPEASEQIAKLTGHPLIDRITSEIPEGSKFLGRGEEALAFKSPQGSVVRVGPSHSKFLSMQGRPAQGRANVPEMLQPFRANTIGDYLVEHLPEVTPISGSLADRKNLEWLAAQAKHEARSLQGLPRAVRESEIADSLSASHNLIADARSISRNLQNNINGYRGNVGGRTVKYDPWDVRPHNASLTKEGNAIVHDAGAIWTTPGSPPIPLPHQLEYPTPEQIEMLKEMGGPEAVRKSMDLGLAQGTIGQGTALPARVDRSAILRNRETLDRFLASASHLDSLRGNIPSDIDVDALVSILRASSAPNMATNMPPTASHNLRFSLKPKGEPHVPTPKPVEDDFLRSADEPDGFFSEGDMFDANEAIGWKPMDEPMGRLPTEGLSDSLKDLPPDDLRAALSASPGGSPMPHQFGAGSGGLDTRFRDLRDRFTMVKNAGGIPDMGHPNYHPDMEWTEFLPEGYWDSRMVGNRAARDQYRGPGLQSKAEVEANELERILTEWMEENPRVEGVYDRSRNVGAIANRDHLIRDPNETYRASIDSKDQTISRNTRHEVGHGIVDQAVKAGPRAIASLPTAWQPGAWLELLSQKTGYGGALGQYVDEVAQYGTQNRGLLNQLRGSAGFATNPDYARAYAELIRGKSPLVAKLIQAPAFAASHPELGLLGDSLIRAGNQHEQLP